MTQTDAVRVRQVARSGLGPTTAPQRVVVVGAGMAGLVCALELTRAGHVVEVLEAQQRVGGRIQTLRAEFSDGLYAEAGAMRIPRAHDLTLTYVQRFGLGLREFTMGNPRGFYHLHGRRHRIGEVAGDPAAVGFELAPHERGKSVAQLWQEAIAPYVTRLACGGDDAWEEIRAELDDFSTREFLESRGWSEDAIELFGILEHQEAVAHAAVLELLREELGHCYTDLVTVDGGMDLLPRAFLPELAGRVRFGAKVVALEQSADAATVRFQTAAGRWSAAGDHVVLAVPFPVLRHVEVSPAFSRAKQRAIRQLHYDAAAKIFLQCRRRFWEDDDGIVGGGSVTDLAARALYYPEHNRESGRGVLLASYTWGADAERWGSLAPHDRIAQVLENVAAIHPQVLSTFEVGASKIWHDDEFAGGAFALFEPGQQGLLHEAIGAREGRVHFAGEHCSLAHAWIQGAVESGLRAALAVHETPGSRGAEAAWR